jgi:arabinose-5-phosphate isomerase
MKKTDIKAIARNVIKTEASAVALLESRIDDIFESAVKSILKCRGRLIISGMGKSGLISQKIASTMSSTGTPTYFVHPAKQFMATLE